MKLTILGDAAGGVPRAGSAGSGLLVTEEDTSILLDCGNGVLGNLRRVATFASINAVLLSHLHLDHCADLLPLLGRTYTTGRCPVFAPEGSGKVLGAVIDLLSSHPEHLTRLLDLRPMSRPARVGPFRLSFRPLDHKCWPPCHGIIARTAGARLVYLADTGYSEGLAEIARGADLLVIAATFLEPGPTDPCLRAAHMTAREAGLVARKARAKSLVLTHIHDLINPEDSRREAAEVSDCPVILAHPLLELFI